MTTLSAPLPPVTDSRARVYWTALVGLFFDYYDLYLFIYLEAVLAREFALGPEQSRWLQFAGLAGVGIGSLVFGFLADRFGRGRVLLAVFGVYAIGVAGLSLAGSVTMLLLFRLTASLALGAEWGISHTYLAERVPGQRRYVFAAFLQFAILGGLLAAFAVRFLEPCLGWRWLFAASILPVAVLSFARRRALLSGARVADTAGQLPPGQAPLLVPALARNLRPFLLCLALASLTIASGTMNVFYAKELPQSPAYTALFWLLVVPGMLGGSWLVRRAGVGRALAVYAAALTLLSLSCWMTDWSGRKLAFAAGLAALNGIPYGLMGAFFNETFREYRTMLSGAAYNLGRILAGFAPVLLTGLGLAAGGRYFLFTAGLGAGVLVLSLLLPRAPARS